MPLRLVYLPDPTLKFYYNKGCCEYFVESELNEDDHPEWNGADRFRGKVIHFKDQESWDELYQLCLHKKAMNYA